MIKKLFRGHSYSLIIPIAALLFSTLSFSLAYIFHTFAI